MTRTELERFLLGATLAVSIAFAPAPLFAQDTDPADTLGAEEVPEEEDEEAYRYPASTETRYDKDIVNVATIRDAEIIRVFNDELGLVFDPDSLPYKINQIEILDLGNDGFGEGDWLFAKPIDEAYRLYDPSERIKEELDRLEMPQVYENYSENTEVINRNLELLVKECSTYVEPDAQRECEIDLCQNVIMKSLMAGLEANYFAVPMRMYFERSSDGVVAFVMWGFDKDAFDFHPIRTESDTIPVYDVVQVTRSDTLLTAHRNFFDLLMIRQTRADTVFVGGYYDPAGGTLDALLRGQTERGWYAPPPPSERPDTTGAEAETAPAPEETGPQPE